jgi:mRNA interferase YafQ
MRRVVRRNRFVKELQQIKRRNLDIRELLAVIDLLADDGAVPEGYKPHRLTGEWEGIWECHIEADWLLIYEITDHEVILHRIGSHLDLFGS